QDTSLNFGGRRQIYPRDLETAQRHGFDMASSRAYPAAIRKERGAQFRGPDAGELEILEACLWVIPNFLKRAEDRKPGGCVRLCVYCLARVGSGSGSRWRGSWGGWPRPGHGFAERLLILFPGLSAQGYQGAGPPGLIRKDSSCPIDGRRS